MILFKKWSYFITLFEMQGLLQQGLFQQSLHNLATGQGVLPQVAAAAAAQQLQQLQESQQQSAKQSLQHVSHQSSQPSLQQQTSGTQIQQNHHQSQHQLHQQNKISTNSGSANNNVNTINSNTNSSSVCAHPLKAAVTRAQEQNLEEMTDLEELEQFAKTFKQRRIKLGKNQIVFFRSHLIVV